MSVWFLSEAYDRRRRHALAPHTGNQAVANNKQIASIPFDSDSDNPYTLEAARLQRPSALFGTDLSALGMKMQRHLWVAMLALCAAVTACSGSDRVASPTAPSQPAVAIVTPPVAVVPVPPPAPTPVDDGLTKDPRFSLAFYRMFVRDGYEEPSALRPLQRQSGPPRIYLRTVDDAGAAIDRLTLDQTAAAIERTTGQLTGAFGIAGLERGTDTRENIAGWITIKWMSKTLAENPRACGRAPVGGTWIEFFPRAANCRCSGGPAVSLRVIKHELGHSLGFWHTDSRSDLMFAQSTTCDQEPSEREVFHARVAYARPIGSFDP